MDPKQFDTLTRLLSLSPEGAPTRRSLLTALGGLLAGARAGAPDAEAKKDRPRVRNRIRRRQKRREKGVACPNGQLLCDGRCAGCCGDADCGGNACRDGQCAECPRGQRLCRGGCLDETACCSDGECTGGQTCIAGACACRENERVCEGACIPKNECCGSDCPSPPPSPTCSSENCRGCCEGNVCKEGDSQNFCGRAGAACSQCQPRESCDAGECVCTTACCADADCVNPKGDALCRPDGTCALEPRCQPNGWSVPGCELEDCCGVCTVATGTCGQASLEDSCHTDDDCFSGNCYFYVCRA